MLRYPDFTARFGPEGLEVRTRRGGELWSWRLAGVLAGEMPLAGASSSAVTPVESAPGVVEYPRGALVERYVAREATVEQQFVIPEPLALAGEDLVVAGRIGASGAFRRAPGGWRWGEGPGAVRLGDVRVYDAAGRVLPASFEVTATATRLVVSASQLAGAFHPVTIDPEIGADDFRISDMGPQGDPLFFAGIPRPAYNSVRQQYLVVWQGKDEIFEGDEIYGQLLDAVTGAEIGENDFRISDMGTDGSTLFNAQDPEVAYNSADDEYLVVWFGDDVADGELEVYGQRIDGATGAEIGENDFRISDIGPDGDNDFQVFEPHVTYNPIVNEYLVVWPGADTVPFELEIYGQRLDGTSGAEVGENDFRISDIGPPGEITWGSQQPAVVHNAVRNEYLVAWSGGNQVDEEFEIFGQRLDGTTGAEMGQDDFRISQVLPFSTFDEKARQPAVAHNPDQDEYLVVFDAVKEQIDPNREVWGQRLDGDGNEIGEDDFRISDAGPEGDDDDNLNGGAPQAAYSAADGEYLVVWSGQDEAFPINDGEAEVWAQRLDGATGGEVGANDFRLSTMGPDGDVLFDGGGAGLVLNPTRNEYLVVWGGDDIVNEDSEIHGQRYTPGLFEDDFEDEEIAPDWALLRGAWSEDQGLLSGVADPVGSGGSGTAALALAAGFAGCDRCRVSAVIEVRSPAGTESPVAASLLGWVRAGGSHVLVLLDTEADEVVFTQREGGAVVGLAFAPTTLERDVPYELEVGFDGEAFKVSLDKIILIEEANGAAVEPSGRFGLGSRNADVAVEGFFVVETKEKETIQRLEP